jgi:hypothetical protein
MSGDEEVGEVESPSAAVVDVDSTAGLAFILDLLYTLLELSDLRNRALAPPDCAELLPRWSSVDMSLEVNVSVC